MDLELKQAFVDLQVLMIETKKTIENIDHQLAVLGRMQMHTNLTQREIDVLPPGTKTYESMARMFVQSDLEHIKQNLRQKTNTLISRIDDLNNRKVCLNHTLNESESNIRDLIQQKRMKNENQPAAESNPIPSKK